MNALNLGYRARLWPSEQGAIVQVQRTLEHANVAIGNLEKYRTAVGEAGPDAAAFALLERGVGVAVVRQGMMGTLVRTTTERVYVSVTSVRVHSGLGAGDGFGGAVCHGLLQGWDLARVFVLASAAGAIVAPRPECSTAIPRISEVERLMAANPQVVPTVSRIRR